LAPGSGTFTEKLIRGPDPILGESLYEYNAELYFDKPFPEKADTVYWLKIAAMVDAPATAMFDPFNPDSSPTLVTQWGWHNRDYTITDPLASPAVVPGEFIEGIVGAGIPVWHFQDDAVSGRVRINPSATGGLRMPDIFQTDYRPQLYLDGIDGPAGGIAGTQGIGQFSKDLAFALYTYSIPEPASAMLAVVALAAISACYRRRGRGRLRCCMN
jgi:hypothetical protein